jgi:hypothetical protein
MLNRQINFKLPLSGFLLILSVGLSAQINNKLDQKQENNNSIQPQEDYFKPDTITTGDDVFNNIKVGIIIPQGAFAQPIINPPGNTYYGINNLNNLTLPFKGEGGMGAKYGYNLQYEGFTSLCKILSGIKPMAHFGVQYGFDFGYIPINWDNVQWSNYNMTVGTSPFFYAGFKVGPAFYFNPVKDMGIGIYGLVDPLVSAPGGENAYYSYTDGSGNSTSARYNLRDSSDFHLNINFSAGFNIYYKAFIIGIEYSWMHTPYNGSVSENESETLNGVITYPAENYAFSNVIQTNMVKLTFGVRLGYGHKHSRQLAQN